MSELHSDSPTALLKPVTPIYLPQSEAVARRDFILRGFDVGFPEFLQRAQDGSASAQAVVAFVYLNQLIYNKKYLELAERWARKSSKQQDAYGCWVLAWVLFEKLEAVEGVSLLLSSAERRFSPALYDLGSFLVNGVVLPRNEKAGIECIRRSASLGHSSARIILEASFKLGQGGWARMVVTRATQPVLKLLRSIWWLVFSAKFTERDLIYIRRLHVENELRRRYGGELIGDDLEIALERALARI